MKQIVYVILFMGLTAFAKTSSKPKVLTQVVHGKTLVEVCTGIKKCSSLHSKQLKDPTIFEVTSVDRNTNESTVLISYKKNFVSLGYLIGTTKFKVNQKLLDLKSAKSLEHLDQLIQERMPQQTAAFKRLIWIENANAQTLTVVESQNALRIAIVKMMASQQSQNLCAHAEEVAKQCYQFTNTHLPEINKRVQIKPALVEPKNQKDLLESLKGISENLEFFNSFLTVIPPKKMDALQKCECKEGLCSLADTPTKIGEEINACINDLKYARQTFQSSESIKAELAKIDEALHLIPQTQQAALAPTTAPAAKEKNALQ